MRSVSKKNIKRFPELHKGDRIFVVDSKMSPLNGMHGVVLHIQDRGRSPYKTIVQIAIEGEYSINNPWYLFRNEIELEV